MELTNEDVQRILRIIDESAYDEISIEYGDLKLHLRRQGSGTGLAPMPAAPPQAPETAVTTRSTAALPAAPPPMAIPEGLVAVRAPMLGTFYRSSAPGAPPYANEGDLVGADSTVCLIEVMKLFNTLKAGVRGRVVRFLVENGAMVEFDQPLLLIDPEARA